MGQENTNGQRQDWMQDIPLWLTQSFNRIISFLSVHHLSLLCPFCVVLMVYNLNLWPGHSVPYILSCSTILQACPISEIRGTSSVGRPVHFASNLNKCSHIYLSNMTHNPALKHCFLLCFFIIILTFMLTII